MTRAELIAWALIHDWKFDRWGHLQQTTWEGDTHRLKLSRIAARHEVKSEFGWVRLSSGYYSKLSIAPDGTLSGMRR